MQKRRSTGGLFAAELICIVLMLLGGSAALAEGSLTDNYAHFVAPSDGDVLPAGEFELRWQYSDEGVTGSAGLMAERYITYLTVYRNGQEIKSDTIKLKSIDFTAPTHSWRTMLREPGDYRFILATGQGTDAPDVLSVTVTEPLREGTCGDGLTWALGGDGTLTISGSGAMENWPTEDRSFPPWEVLWKEITAVTLGGSAESIGSDAFNCYSEIREVRFGGGCTRIGESAFYRAESIQNLWLDEGLRVIDERAFEHCSGMTAIYLPASLGSIGSYAFYHCGALRHVYYGGTEAQWEAIEISGEYNDDLFNAELHCGWGADPEAGELRLPEGLTEIGEEAFAGDASLGAVHIPDSVTEIAENAFEGSWGVAIHCSQGSAARAFAGAQGLMYRLE